MEGVRKISRKTFYDPHSLGYSALVIFLAVYIAMEKIISILWSKGNYLEFSFFGSFHYLEKGIIIFVEIY